MQDLNPRRKSLTTYSLDLEFLLSSKTSITFPIAFLSLIMEKASLACQQPYDKKTSDPPY